MADPLSWPGDAFNAITGVMGAPIDKADDVLNPDQKAKLSAILARNGWGQPNSDTNKRARAVVQRESHGDANVVNKIGATGLFQILTPLHCGAYGIPKPTTDCVQWLKDPDNNAKAARALFRSAGWQPWISSGPIPPPPTDWDPEITTDKDTLVTGASEVASAVASPFTSVASAAVDLIGTLLSADTWFRIGKGWLGFVLVVTGTGSLVFIVANRASGGQVARAAKAAATKGVVK